MACLNGMLPRDGDVSLHSYVLRKLAQMHLRDDLNPRARQSRLTLQAVQQDAQVLFSVLAQHGHADETDARRAYEAGMHHLIPRERPAYGIAGPWAPALDLALSRLDQLVPVGKEQLVEAMLATVTHDQQLTIRRSGATARGVRRSALPVAATGRDADAYSDLRYSARSVFSAELSPSANRRS
jgi:hypothetical protein